jgi:chaperone modulatory protein CbpM
MTDQKKGKGSQECEEWFVLSLSEVTTSFGVSTETVIEIVNEGIVSVQQDENNKWLFDNEAIRRIATVLRLHRDLGVNLAGAGLALELLKEIDRLKGLLSDKKL